MKRDKKNIFTIIIITLCGLVVVAIFLFLTEYNKLWPSEPVTQGNFPSSPAWIFYADQNLISSPAAQSQIAFIKTPTTLYALNILDNNIEWKVKSSTNRDLVFPPVLIGSLVIVIEDASTLAAYSVVSGELIWKTPPLQIAETGTDPIRSIAFNSQYLYVARYNLNITAYNLKSGDVVWKHDLPGRSNPYLAASEEYVFFTAGEDAASILDINSGHTVWNYDGKGYFGPVLLSGGTLYITDEMHASLISLDINSRQIQWVKELPVSTYEFSCIVDIGDHILVTAEKLMMISKQNGATVWATGDIGYLECPTLLNNEIFVRNNQTDLYMFDKESGNEKGKLQVRTNTLMKRDFFRGPIIVKGFLVVPFGDNRLLIYKP